jgi:hypothetical protein
LADDNAEEALDSAMLAKLMPDPWILILLNGAILAAAVHGLSTHLGVISNQE